MSSDDQVELGMSLPLDLDGFLRRECPTCGREFKAFVDPDEDDDAEPDSDEGYFCPYCGVQAPGDAWWTKAQLELAESIIVAQVVGPAVKDLDESFKNLTRRSQGMVRTSVKYDEPEEADPLTEEDDMRRVDFGCHPTQPLKVLDDWRKPARCYICGEASAA